MSEPNNEEKETLKTAEKFFGGAVETKKKIKIPTIKGPVIEVGEMYLVDYMVSEADGLKAYKHIFNNGAKIYSKPGADWFLVQGRFKFTKNGFVNK
jgi:hypothetical protein